MTRLACRVCGRRVDSAVPAAELTRDERRCPRCGARLEDDRRETKRRRVTRRANPVADPGPPEGVERRERARRVGERRREETVVPWSIAADGVGTGGGA